MHNYFTIEQKKAINHKTGAMLVLAGPGSGKTTVIVNRIKTLVDSGVDEDSILVVTFTKAAASQMKDRYEKLTKKSSSVTFGTFHRIFFGIISKKYGIKKSNILPEIEKFIMLNNLIIKYNNKFFNLEDDIKTLDSEIARVKRENINPNEFASEVIKNNKFANAFKEYRDNLLSKKYIDFEDMEVISYKLLLRDNNVLYYWKNKYKYILIDEFQDINKIQYNIIKLLLDENENIFVVGDDDQSIYEFRGAMPSIMLNFAKDYKSCEKIYLSQNFRSCKKIVEYSNRLIENNENRYEKSIFTKKINGKVDITCYEDEDKQIKDILKKVKKLIKDGYEPREIAILTRLNIYAHRFAYNFNLEGIEYISKLSKLEIFNHWAVIDILAYYKYAFNYNLEDILKIYNKPTRYIKRDYLIKSQANLKTLKYLYRSNVKMINQISELEDDFNNIKRLPNFAKAVKYILYAINYQSFLEEEIEKRDDDYDRVFTIIQMVVDICGECKDLKEVLDKINDYNTKMNSKKNVENGVNLMTIHSSKGLEFRAVFIPYINDRVIPYERKGKTNDEEERRLLYVAMTRAIDILFMSYCKTIKGKSCFKSIFIDEII